MSREMWSVVATTFAVVVLLLGLGGSVFSSATALSLSQRVQQQAKQIQAQRMENIITACESQNTRNRKAYVFLSALPVDPRAPKQPAKQRIELIHGFTDALVGPIHSDCTAYAKSLTH